MDASRRLRIAVVGSGISGLSAAWLLSKQHQVVIFDREKRLGGHSNTVDVAGPTGDVAVDTGFIVFNDWTYPNLIALFKELDVPTLETDMSFGVSVDQGDFEYSGGTLFGLFGQPSNIIRPRFWRMMADLHRFYSTAPQLLAAGKLDDKSLGDMLDEGKYSTVFQRDHLLPMAAAIWSGTVVGMRDYPATAFVRFFVNHGLFKYTGRPMWRTVQGGSREYVKRISNGIETRLGAGVRTVKRTVDGATIIDGEGHEDTFDAVVMACHADQTREILSDLDVQETEILTPFKYQMNTAVLHSDPALMPRRKSTWSSWNYLTETNRSGSNGSAVCVSYWMNLLQSLDPTLDLFVTLNPTRAPSEDKIHRTFEYEHPLYDAATDAAQKELWRLQGHRNTWYCGSYFGAGFHEDGLQSGLAAAESLGHIRRPWRVENESGRIHLSPNEKTLA
jgi:predicted NAD/FAD-binding protein